MKLNLFWNTVLQLDYHRLELSDAILCLWLVKTLTSLLSHLA